MVQIDTNCTIGDSPQLCSLYQFGTGLGGNFNLNITCGTDIIEVDRVQEAIENLGENFLNKIFTKNEIEYCNSKKNMKYQHFAARFAAKEAIYKAMSDFLENKYEITWTDVEILNNEKGKPIVHFINKQYPITQIDVSMSHLKEYAIATCIVTIKM